MSDLEEIRNRFKNDHFATDATGIVIDSAEPGKAVCSMTLEKRHMNENNVPMGGAVFTLADFVCAIAANFCLPRQYLEMFWKSLQKSMIPQYGKALTTPFITILYFSFAFYLRT